LEEIADGYLKGAREKIQSASRYSILPEFILLDLLGGDTHQVSQSIQTQTSLKASLLQAVANMDVDWMNFCPLGGSVHRYRSLYSAFQGATRKPAALHPAPYWSMTSLAISCSICGRAQLRSAHLAEAFQCLSHERRRSRFIFIERA
jgi:hypothetical protein